jgi:hypothetical protein
MHVSITKKKVTCSLAVQLGSIHFLMIALRYNRKIGFFSMEAKQCDLNFVKKNKLEHDTYI